MSFPNGMVATTAEVHPAAVYEAIAAFLLAAALWQLRSRKHPYFTIGAYAVAAGATRFLIEFIRINDRVIFGLTQPQLWSLLLMAAGVVALVAPRGGAVREATPAMKPAHPLT